MKPPATHHTNYPHPSALHPRHSLTVSRSLPYPLSPRRSLAFLNRCSGIHFLPLRSRRNLKDAEAVRFDGPVLDVKEIQGEECELVVETCVTRTLPPVVTMEAGLQSIKDAVEELKLNPPSSSSGVLRFQVALPPSPKALNWFCAHPPLSGVFPRFFLSKETGDPSCKTLHLNRTHGVLGIGAAIYFTHSSCSSPGDRKSLIRSLPADISQVIQLV